MSGTRAEPRSGWWRLLALCVLTVLGACRGDSGRAGSRPLVVGFVGALTGSQAYMGGSARDGALLAIEQANAAGGVGGRPVELRAYDSQGRPEEAATAAVRLASQDRAVFIVAGDSSGSTLAMAGPASRGQVPLVAAAATNPRVTVEGGPYVFRVCFIDSFQGTALAGLAISQGLRRVGILLDMKSEYSVGLARAFQARLAELGGTVVAEETYATGDTDFRAQLTHLKSQHPDALFVPGYYAEAAFIARQARQLDLKVPLLGGDGWDSVTELVALGGAAVEGSEFTTHFSPDNPSPQVQAFLQAFQARFGHPPPSGSALGYDSTRVGLEALRRASAPTGAALRDALAQTAAFDGVTGKITLGPSRDAVKSAVVLSIRGGRAAFVSELSP